MSKESSEKAPIQWRSGVVVRFVYRNGTEKKVDG